MSPSCFLLRYNRGSLLFPEVKGCHWDGSLDRILLFLLILFPSCPRPESQLSGLTTSTWGIPKVSEHHLSPHLSESK